ncbi:hypothetical protein HOT75_gp129 [Gordonia phage Daredevil]|uniref:Uncharacterized protein n=1 Tax=Gordonia phage Daredevil TaxID=2283286 RepID=A0A345MJ22_9CAUD|nr:hypothetical protein HOT75_gp129 [Gordonia phage Daredevil]AXH70553.1 hypothetical protein SEA_DAREDEVIL_129 [Gordonia phage Daredevil]
MADIATGNRNKRRTRQAKWAGGSFAAARRRERMHRLSDQAYAAFLPAQSNMSAGHTAIGHGQTRVRGVLR